MERALAQFLKAAGLNLSDTHLKGTPARVTEAFTREFLEGYRRTPEEALGETYPAPPGSSGELVVVTGLRFRSMCPHHLLPYEGLAHLAYVPAKRVVGFGRLSLLLDCFAHRLMLQEELARQVAASLARVLESPGTACLIRAEQACLRLRGESQREARTHSEAYEGVLRRDRSLRKELWARVTADGGAK
jgi:GTP cyclohydrolase I